MISIRKLIASFKFAFAGLFYSINNNQNVKIHLIIACLVFALGLILRFSKEELLAIGIVIILVICAEMKLKSYLKLFIKVFQKFF